MCLCSGCCERGASARRAGARSVPDRSNAAEPRLVGGARRRVCARAAADAERPRAESERGQSLTAAPLQSQGWWAVPGDVSVLVLLRTRSVRAPGGNALETKTARTKVRAVRFLPRSASV